MSLKTGLIGAGVFGGYHAGKIAEAQTTDFVGVFDPDAARAAELAEKHGVKAFASQAELFAAADAVLIACPAIYHAETVEAALAANCHVLVEKPLALTGKTAKALAAQADRVLLVAESPASPVLADAVQQGPLPRRRCRSRFFVNVS